jgi:hypothetical protein
LLQPTFYIKDKNKICYCQKNFLYLYCQWPKTAGTDPSAPLAFIYIKKYKAGWSLSSATCLFVEPVLVLTTDNTKIRLYFLMAKRYLLNDEIN